MNLFEGRRIAVVDVETRNIKLLEEYLTRNGAEIKLYTNSGDAMDGLDAFDADAVVIDVKLDKMSGIELLRTIRGRNPLLPVLLTTAATSVETAITGLYEGAFYYLTKPFNLNEFGVLLTRALEYSHSRSENLRLKEEIGERIDNYGLLGNHHLMRVVRNAVEMVAPTHSNVLILGEAGTGKETVAREIHRLSLRKDAPFVRVDCASYREHRLEIELFGHVGEAETGASVFRGKIELADRGTILLDEVTAIPLNLQHKLLRVVQDGELYRVGTSNFRRVNVRVIATTSQNIEDEVLFGRFRKDLYFRLNVIPIRLPPLRERKEDILLLVNHFISRYECEWRRPINGITAEALTLLKSYAWQGNIRELASVIEHAVLLCRSNNLEEADFVSVLSTLNRMNKEDATGSKASTMYEVEKNHILTMLASNQYNRTRTAEALDISIRTLRNKLNEYREDGSFVEPGTGKR